MKKLSISREVVRNLSVDHTGAIRKYSSSTYYAGSSSSSTR